MLWSDPENKPPKFLREMQALISRTGVLLAVAAVLAVLLTGTR
ncbi:MULTISPECIES: morphogenic membrane protein MmpB [unclassified Streptomyces]|nr:hypothetical protein [Streptomyces sp. NRRL B-24572]